MPPYPTSCRTSLRRCPTIRVVVLGFLASSLAPAGAAVVITQWNFNSVAADGSLSTGSLMPAVGTGAVVLVGAVTSTFADGGGSGDPAPNSDDSGLNLSAFPAQGTGNRSRGVAYFVNTSGYSGITLTFDQRNSNTASSHWAVEYTLDGSTWNSHVVSGANTSGGLFQINLGETWFNGLTVDFSSIASAGNNPNFGVRFLAAFNPATGSGYSPSNTGSTYGSTGSARHDMVTFLGTAVPEPGRAALLLVAVTLAALRRRRTRPADRDGPR